jgi:SAM-dependent methyltransferase
MATNYYRDVWALHNSKNGYPGSFPAGFIKNVKRKWWGQNRLWLFSGSFCDPEGVTVDIKQHLKPSVTADCQRLPFQGNSFDFVLADPPYSEQESRELYNLPYCSITKVLQEMLRVCKPGGHILFLHRIVPTAHPSVKLKNAHLTAVVGIYTVAGLTNIRALTVYRKRNTLSEWSLPTVAASP